PPARALGLRAGRARGALAQASLAGCSRPPGAAMTTPSAVRGRVPGASLAAGLLTAAYAGLFMRFGIFDVADEGLLLTQAYRVAAGQRPYLDFHTGYGPLYFDLTGWLMRTGGVAAIRAALVGVHAIGAALLVEFVQRRLGSRLAWVALALLVAFFM